LSDSIQDARHKLTIESTIWNTTVKFIETLTENETLLINLKFNQCHSSYMSTALGILMSMAIESFRVSMPNYSLPYT